MESIFKAKCDGMFKLLFANSKDTSLITSFLKVVLDIPEDEYESVKIVDPFVPRREYNDKPSILDVLIETKSGKMIDVEIQVRKNQDMIPRVVYYNAKILSSQLSIGEHYENLKKTISVIICTDHILLSDRPQYHNKFLLREEDGYACTDLMEIHFLELRKIPEQDRGLLASWLRFFDTDSERDLEYLAQKKNGLDKAVDMLKHYSGDKGTTAYLDAIEKAKRDKYSEIKTARNDGIKEGLKEGLKEVAKKLLDSGSNIDFVTRITGLSFREIEKLKNGKEDNGVH